MESIAKHHQVAMSRAATQVTTQQLVGLYRMAANGLKADVSTSEEMIMTRVVATGTVFSRCVDRRTGFYVQLSGPEKINADLCHISVGQLYALEYADSPTSSAVKYWEAPQPGLRQG